jgi:hypothetical protein
MPSNRPLTTMTILELTQLMTAQDDRWGQLITYAQSTQNPAAHTAMDFFKHTWRSMLTLYFENVASKYAPTAQVTNDLASWLVQAMSDTIYPAARRVGFTDKSFLLPDLNLVQSGHPAAPPTISGAEPPREGWSWKDWGILAAVLGAGYAFVVRPQLKEYMQDRAAKREAGIQSDMTKEQQEAAWEAFYAKNGFRLTPTGALERIA